MAIKNKRKAENEAKNGNYQKVEEKLQTEEA